MSSADVVSDYLTGTYKVYRRTSGGYVGGKKVASHDVDADVTAIDLATGKLTVPGHGLTTGNGTLWISSSQTIPAGYDGETPYWAIVVDPNTLQLAASRADALAGAPVVVPTDVGVGVVHVASYFLMQASILPLTGRDLKDLPEGQYGEEKRDIFSTVELKGRGDGYEADVFSGVDVAGDLWRVEDPRHHNVVSDHWRATLVRETTP